MEELSTSSLRAEVQADRRWAFDGMRTMSAAQSAESGAAYRVPNPQPLEGEEGHHQVITTL